LEHLHKVRQVLKDQQEVKEPQDPLDHKVHKDPLDHKVHKVLSELLQ
jgi:hypothetical protein